MGHLVKMPNFVAKKKMRLVPSSDSQLVKEKHPTSALVTAF